MQFNLLRRFLKLESAAGIVLVIAAIIALLVNNSPLSTYYNQLLQLTISLHVGSLHISEPVLLWINDGLMAIFFLVIGLEIKREILEGKLTKLSQIVLPAMAAIGGMLVPALVYIAINWSDSLALRGWAIPAATDIAFALGVLALLGKQVPTTLKLFLLTLAIMDDLGAIIIIAIFYTEHIAWLFISLAGLAIITLIVMNLLGVVRKAAYILVGILLWFFVLESGVHATLAGVVLALTIPLRAQDGEGRSPLRTLENSLHPWVAYAILPLFAFANAGVPLQGIHWSVLLEPVTLGVALGLIIGKQIGVFSFSWLAIKLGIAALPQRVSWQQLYGVSVLCGIGFTMSLFIGGLAFSGTPVADNGLDRIGILLGSLISAVSGYGLLHLSLKKQEPRYSGQAIRPAGHRLDDSPELEKQQTTS